MKSHKSMLLIPVFIAAIVSVIKSFMTYNSAARITVENNVIIDLNDSAIYLSAVWALASLMTIVIIGFHWANSNDEPDGNSFGFAVGAGSFFVGLALAITSLLFFIMAQSNVENSREILNAADYTLMKSDEGYSVSGAEIRAYGYDYELPENIQNILAQEDNSNPSEGIYVIKNSDDEWAWAWVEINDNKLEVGFEQELTTQEINGVRAAHIEE